MAAIFEVVTQGFDKLSAAVKQIEAASQAQLTLQREANSLNRSLQTLITGGFNRLEAALMTNVRAVNLASSATTKLASSFQTLSKSQGMAASAGAAYNSQLSQGNAVQSKLNKSTVDLKNSQTNLGSAFRGVGAATGTLFLTYGKMIPMLTAFAAASATISSLKLATEFDYITRYATEVAAASGDASVTLQDLQKTILGFTGLSRGPLEIAAGYRELVKAGYSAQESLSQIEYVTKFAVVSEMKMADATQALVGITRAFAEPGQDMAAVADIIAKAALLSSTDVKEMTDAMSHLTELASVADTSLTEVAAAMGIMSNAGIRGSKAATSLRTSILRILSPTEGLQKAMDAAGVSIDAISDDGKIKGMKELFSSVQKIINVLPKKEQVGFLADMFDIRQMKSAATMLESIKLGDWDTFFGKLEQAKGYVGDLHTELQKPSKFWADELVASFERAALGAVDVDSVTEALKSMNTIVSDPAFSAGLGALAAGVLNLGNAILQFVSGPVGALGQIITRLSELKGQMAAFYDFPEIKLPDFLQRTEGGLLDTLLSPLDVSKKVDFVSKKASAAVDFIADKITATREDLFMKTLPARSAAVPTLAATGIDMTPPFLGAYSAANKQAAATLKQTSDTTAEAISYSIVSLDPVVNNLDEGVAKYLEKVGDHVAASGTQAEKKAHAIAEAQREVSILIDGIRNAENYKSKELSPRQAAQINALEEGLKKDIAAIEKSYDQKDSVIEKREQSLQDKMSQIQNTQFQFMPEGMAKDLQEINSKYEQGVAAVEPYISAQGEVGAQAQKTISILDKWKADATFQTQRKYAQEFADTIADARNELTALSSKDKTLGKLEKELQNISTGFEKFRNAKIDEIFKLSGDSSAEAKKTADGLRAIVDESYAVEKATKAAFKAELIKDFNKTLKETNEQFELIDPHTARLKEIDKIYDDLIDKAKDEFKIKGDINNLEEEGVRQVNELVKAKEAAKQKDIELLRTSNNLWDGFHAGALEAQADLVKLGGLGYNIFQDLHEGFKNIFSDILTGEFDNISTSVNNMFDAMKQTAVDWAAEKLATAATNMLDSLLSSLGLGSFGERGSSANNPVWVRSADRVGGATGGLTGEGGVLDSIKGWVGEVFGEKVASAIGSIGSAIGIAGGAYGMYSGIKNMQAGNMGSGMLQTGLGAVSMYKGAVGMGILEKGIATNVAKSLAGKLGIEIGATAGKTMATTMAQTAASRSAMYAAQQSLISGQAATGVTTGATTSAAGGASAGGASAGGGLSAGAVAAGATYAVAAAAAVLVAKGIFDKASRPSAAAEIDEYGVTPADLGKFRKGWADTNGTILQSIPTLQRYRAAVYDSTNSVLTLSSQTSTMALQYNAAAAAGHQWSTMMVVGSQIVRDAAMRAEESADSVSLAFSSARDIAEAENESLKALAAMAAGAKASVGGLATQLGNSVYPASSAAAAVSQLSNTMNGLSPTANSASASVDGLMGATGGMGSTASSAASSVSTMTGALNGVKPPINSFSQMMIGLGGAAMSAAHSLGSAARIIYNAAGEAQAATAPAAPAAPAAEFHASGGMFTEPTRIGNHVFGEAGAEAIVPLPFGPETFKILFEMLARLEQKSSGKPKVEVYIGNKQLHNEIKVVADELDSKRVGGGRRYIG